MSVTISWRENGTLRRAVAVAEWLDGDTPSAVLLDDGGCHRIARFGGSGGLRAITGPVSVFRALEAAGGTIPSDGGETCSDGGETKPAPAPAPKGTRGKERTCLKCGVRFKSSGPGNRICPRCAKENAGLSPQWEEVAC